MFHLQYYNFSFCHQKINKPNREFSEAEIVQITQLVQEFREAIDPIRCIMEKLEVKRPKKHIIDKIVELGLVGDRKELRKKRSKKTANCNFAFLNLHICTVLILFSISS